MFFCKEKEGPYRFRLEPAAIERPLTAPNTALADRGLEEQHGKLFAVRLEPGIYQLVRFAVRWPSQQNIDFSEPIEFGIFPNEPVYLGNLAVHFCIRHAYANQYGLSGVIVTANDLLARDAPLLRNKFIGLRRLRIAKKVISQADLQERTASLGRGCE